MKTNQATGKQYCSTRQELAKKYFDTFGDGVEGVYAKGNMGIVTLLSDAQHVIGDAHYVEIMNDIKSILIEDMKKAEDLEDKFEKLPADAIIGTSLIGYLKKGTTFQELKVKLGKPTIIEGENPNVKVQVEWVFKIGDVQFSIYDWKTEVPHKENVNWNIGGKKLSKDKLYLLERFLGIEVERS